MTEKELAAGILAYSRDHRDELEALMHTEQVPWVPGEEERFLEFIDLKEAEAFVTAAIKAGGK